MYVVIVVQVTAAKRTKKINERENSHCSLYRGGTLDTEVISSTPYPFYHLHLLQFQPKKNKK